MHIQQQIVKTTKKVLEKKSGFLDWEEILEYTGKNPEVHPFRTSNLYGVVEWKITFEDGSFFYADDGVDDKLWLQDLVKVKVKRHYTGVSVLDVSHTEEEQIKVAA